MIQQAYPEIENKRDNFGRFPKELANQSEKSVFTPADKTLILANNVVTNQSYNLNAEKKLCADNAVVVCQSDILI